MRPEDISLAHRSAVILVVLSCLGLGCAMHRGPQTIQGGMTLRDRVQPLIGMESYTDDDVLRLAGEAFDLRLHERAFLLYSLYLEEFGDGTSVGVARYNAALSAQRCGRYDEAIELYDQHLEATMVEAERVAVMFQLVECTVASERWVEAQDHIAALLRRGDTTTTDRFELRVQRAWVDAGSGEVERGRQELEKLVGRYRRDRGRTLGGFQGAMAHYYLGEVYRLMAESVELVHVDELVVARRELERKATYILEAQDAYLDSIRLGVHAWIPRSGYRLGGLYVQFRKDILEAPYPSGVSSDEDREIYREILNEQTATLLLKARTVYRKVLDKAAEVNMHDEWIAHIRDSLRRLERELLTHNLAADI